MPFPQGALARPAHPLRLALARSLAPALALVGEFEADACARPPALFEYSRATQTVPRVLWVLACARPPLVAYSRGTVRDSSGTRT
jgi:hypothetical protein